MNPALATILFGSNAPEWARGYDVWYDFTIGRGASLGRPLTDADITDTHAHGLWAPNSAHIWSLFAANVPVRTDLGLQTTPARTNVVLWDRDLTNAAWTKTSVTATKDQTGIDGVGSSATRLTATGANGTVLQAVTLGSSARFQSAFVRRRTGTGTIEMTMDGGTTWTAITPGAAGLPLGHPSCRVVIPTQTIANPSVGFRIATSGDEIDVDFVQNENGNYLSSPIETSTVAISRNGNSPQRLLLPAGKLASGVTGLIQCDPKGTNAAGGAVMEITNAAANGANYVRLAYSAGDMTIRTNNASANQGAVVGQSPAVTGVQAIAFASGQNFESLRVVGQAAPSPDTVVSFPTDFNQLSFGCNINGTLFTTTRRVALKFGVANADTLADAHRRASLLSAA